jgi:hypothetical protein
VSARGPAGQTWNGDWQIWAQLDQETILADITGQVIEAQWSTDSYTMGDGSYRGDLQPGRLTLRCLDPAGTMRDFDNMATIWLHYAPANLTWLYFLDSRATSIAPEGSPNPGLVLAADSWPPRLMNDCWAQAERGKEPVANRMAHLYGRCQNDPGLHLPRIPGDSFIAPQGQYVDPIAWITGPNNSRAINMTIGHLPQLRKDSADGIFWARPRRAAGGWGEWPWSYDRWEAVWPGFRTLAPDQILAGPPVTRSTDWVTSVWKWSGRDAYGEANHDIWQFGSGWGIYGIQGPSPDVWAALQYPETAETAAVLATGQAVLNARSHAGVPYLSDVTVRSGTRFAPDGTPRPGSWDPLAHHWPPIEVLEVTHDGATRQYHVARSEHRLTSKVWETKHSLEVYVPATPLP